MYNLSTKQRFSVEIHLLYETKLKVWKVHLYVHLNYMKRYIRLWTASLTEIWHYLVQRRRNRTVWTLCSLCFWNRPEEFSAIKLNQLTRKIFTVWPKKMHKIVTITVLRGNEAALHCFMSVRLFHMQMVYAPIQDPWTEIYSALL